MARILFIQNAWFSFTGTMSLSAVLKSAGHACDVVIGRRIEDIVPTVNGFDPDIIAFSVMTGSDGWARDISRALKKDFNVFIVWGGPHPTFFPHVVEDDGVDAVCIGEGEGALTELADRLDADKTISDIANLWIKLADGSIRKNSVRTLIAQLDELPFPDRTLYRRFTGLALDPVQTVLTGRGCPFDCSFCFNHSLKKIYEGKGPYVRRRSPENVVSEINALVQQGNTKRIYFIDDTFSLNRTWLERFLTLYAEQVPLPFHCLVRIDHIDDHLAEQLAASGCKTVFFGIESGNEDIRNRLIGKHLSEALIRKGADILHRHGIKFRTYNILGLPGETVEQAIDTIKLNIAIRTPYPWCSLFKPYPGTPLGQYALERGMCVSDRILGGSFDTFHAGSTLSGPEMRRTENLHKFFQTVVLFPRLLPLVLHVIGLRPNLFFRSWFSFVYFILYCRSEGRLLLSTFNTGLRNVHFFTGRNK